MPRPLPAEFHLRAVALVRAGKSITKTAQEPGVSAASLHKWVHQDKMDSGERAGVTTRESVELSRVKRRIRGLKMEVEILRLASKILGKHGADPKGFIR